MLEVNGINNRKGRLDIGLTQATLDGTSYLVAMRPVPALHAAVVAYVAERDVYGKIDAYSGWIAELAIVAVVIVLFFSYWIYRIIHQPLALLVKSFRHAEKGQLVPIGSTSRHDEFGYLYKQYNRTIEKLDELIHQVYEQKLRAQASELKQLQSQINPHFLYNTYFTLYRLAMIEDNESVARFSSYLGEYFHYITRHPDDAVPLRLEVKHTQTYAEIQRFRFDDRITTFWDPVPDDAAELVVPKLILQPIIENAYKHGLENKLTGGGLRIRFRHDAAAATLAIAIEDNGSVVSLQDAAGWTLPLHARDEAAEGTGLRNVHRRLQLMYGETSGITLAVSEEFGGLQVMLTIRYGKKEQP
ncbi:MAG: histidine kinase [Paenibacillaceae bacterium]|nr:histidine kinase [Paenibacillaceae bacterium]